MENYFGSELFVLKLLGLCLTGNESKPYRVYSFVYFFSSFVYLLLDIYELTKHDFDVFAELLSYVTAMTLALAKSILVYTNRTKICELLDKIQREPFLPDSKRGGNKEAKIVTECLTLTKIQTTTGIISTDCEENDYIVLWTISKTHLTKAVSYHVNILDLAEEAENLFSGLLLFVFAGTLSVMCLSIYAATMASNQTQMITHLFAAAGSCIQVLIICYWGEKVSNESDLVGQAAYETDFVGTDQRFQKALGLIIRRSQNTSKLTAGKFAVVSLVTFGWILRTSYSAFMVLRRENET